MIIKSVNSKTKSDIFIDDYSIIWIENCGDKYTEINFIGTVQPLIIETPFAEMENIFKDAKSRDRFTDQPKTESKSLVYDEVIVGIYKFRLDIRKTKFEDGLSTSLHLEANFPLANHEELKDIINNIDGVEDYSNFSFSKYTKSISVGRMFDAEDVRNMVELNIKKYLSEIKPF